MPDLSEQLLPRLKEHRLPGLDLGDGFQYPQYAGQSILNLPSSVCRLLGAPEMAAPALIPEILGPLGEGVRHVVVVLMDALPLYMLRRWLAAGDVPVWSRLVEQGLMAPLTSITPSTTSAAITSLWTGRSAAEHGIVGYEMWLKEYGVVANMIAQRPMSFNTGLAESLSLAGFNPETYLPYKTIGEQLAAHGIKSYAFQHHSIARSGLSRMFFRDVNVVPVSTPADLWIGVRKLLENRPADPTYAWVYWGEVDHMAHFYGPTDERPAAEFAAFSLAMESLFINKLSAQTRKDTVLILTADHGQIHTPIHPHYDLRNHPNLVRRLHIYPTGENRLMYLFARAGQAEAVREYMERTWPRQFRFIDPAFAVECGLFGPGEPHPRLLDRLGDMVVATQADAYLWWADRDNPLVGRHGGLSPEEMLVPFVAVRW